MSGAFGYGHDYPDVQVPPPDEWEQPGPAFVPDTPAILPPPSDPMQVGRDFIARRYESDGEPTLRRQGNTFWQYDGTCWPEVEPPDLRAELYQHVEHAVYVKTDSKGRESVQPWEPTRYKIDNLVDALAAGVLLPSRFEPPCWIGEPGSVSAADLVSFGNGLLRLTDRQLYAHTPALWVHHSLPYDYAPAATEPIVWLTFLREIFGDTDDGQETTDTLQEWFGYVVSGSTAQQKAALMVGPRRSGKGTVARVLAALIGGHNTCGPTLSSLATGFGLAPLIGKPLAIVSDARLSNRSDSSIVVERLLSITGEDTLTVDRKYREAWTGKFSTRFLVLSNELPNFSDSSGAVASRFIVLLTEQSFLGREDITLTDRLMTELPGILNWSLAGLDRLRDRGHFIQPAAAQEAAKALADMASPVSVFVEERCEIGPLCSVPVDALYDAYKAWCGGQNINPSVKAVFGRDLAATSPAIRKTRPREGYDRRYFYAGVQLRGAPS